MNRLTELTILIVIFFAGAGMIPENALHSQSKQLILVTTSDWNDVQGRLQRYDRSSPRSKWRKVGDPINVVVGRSGLGWEDGAMNTGQNPVKKEGDGRSPAGIFPLTSAFGYGPASGIGALKIPYLQATSTIECVDDTASSHYNQLLDRHHVEKPDWKSSEQMLRKDDLYRIGVVVGHNQKREAGRGSCIFLHIWENDRTGTAGCTAMEANRMEEILRWLDAEKKPILVQLPQGERDRLEISWNLPRDSKSQNQ